MANLISRATGPGVPGPDSALIEIKRPPFVWEVRPRAPLYIGRQDLTLSCVARAHYQARLFSKTSFALGRLVQRPN